MISSEEMINSSDSPAAKNVLLGIEFNIDRNDLVRLERQMAGSFSTGR